MNGEHTPGKLDILLCILGKYIDLAERQSVWEYRFNNTISEEENMDKERKQCRDSIDNKKMWCRKCVLIRKENKSVKFRVCGWIRW